MPKRYIPTCTSYQSVFNYLTERGSTYRGAVPLYTVGGGRDDSNIIGHWGYNSAGLIAPMGYIDFSKATPGYGIVASVTNGTTLVLTAGHTLPEKFSALVWDISGAAELFVGVQASVSTNTLTMPDTTGIAAGDVIYLHDNEFSFGGTTRDFRPYANTTAYVGASGIVMGSSTGLSVGKLSGHLGRMVCNVGSSTDLFLSASFRWSVSISAPQTTQRAVVGVWDTVSDRVQLAGTAKAAGSYNAVVYTGDKDSQSGPSAVSDVMTGPGIVGSSIFCDYVSNNRYSYGNVSIADHTTWRTLSVDTTIVAFNALWFETVPAAGETIVITCGGFSATV